MKKIYLLITLVMAAMFFSCNQLTDEGYNMQKDILGQHKGKEVVLITLTNSEGNSVKLTNLGATIVWIGVPDRNGNIENVTFGYETLDGYINGDPYFGSVVGRYANRIARGKFELDGEEYSLTLNNGPNTLHGGPEGWHSAVWDVIIDESETDVPQVKFSYYSPDMEEGYPGNVTVEVVYKWTDDNEIIIDYKCSSDKNTVLNITNHAYFNLHGAGNGNILDHQLMIAAESFTPVDETLIPTGEFRPVEGTPFDFTSLSVIGERIEEDYDQLILGIGYDHNFVLANIDEVDAVVYEPVSGRMIEMMTDQPGVQFYCGNFLDGSQTGHGGKVYEHRGGLCLETQHFPDSPNQPEFPSCILEAGKPFTSQTVYRFSVK